MKCITLTATVLVGFMSVNIASAHSEGSGGGMGMMGGGMMGYDMMGYNMMMDDAGCPMMMNMAMSIDYLLAYKEDLELAKSQVASLKKMRDTHQKDAVALSADLSMKMLQMNNLISDEEINLVKMREVNSEIERIESALRNKNIEVFAKAKMQLTREQLKKARQMGIFDIQMHRGNRGMMMR